MEPVIHLRAAVTLLGRFPALAGIDLDVDRREIVLVRGPNGAGKSTLLRLCAGLLPLNSGEGSVLGLDLHRDRQSLRPRVGLLGHQTFLYEDLTVAENVAFWTRATRGDIDDGRRAMRRLGLDGRLANVATARLSTGQRRRTAIAVVMARRPELWLLDEPYSGLDAEGRDLLDEMVAEAVSVGATVLMASHEHERVEDVAHRVVWVAGGVVQPEPVADSLDSGASGVA